MKIFKIILVLLFFTNGSLICQNWEEIRGWSNIVNVQSFDVNENSIYLAQDEKIFKTDDFGLNWKQLKKESFSVAFGINHVFYNDNTLFIQSRWNSKGPYDKLVLTKDEGKSWDKGNSNFDYYLFFDFIKDKKDLYSVFKTKVGYKNPLNIYQYDFNNKNWFSLLDSATSTKIVNIPKTILKYSNKILIGTDVNKTAVSQGIKRPNIFIYNFNDKTLLSMLDSTSDLWRNQVNCFLKYNNSIFAGTSTGMYKSEDGGITWKKNIHGLQYNYIFAITSYPPPVFF